MAKELSCADCSVYRCNNEKTGAFPAFCVSERIPEEVRNASIAEYEDPQNRSIMNAAAEVEFTGYGNWTRVREIMEFANRMGYKRLGIATCIGLLKETHILAEILRSNGFEVFGIACKSGMVPKVDVGIDPKCNGQGRYICNPILQAKMLKEERTEFNIVMGLCVGHDSLFYKYSEAPVTTLVAKDRVTGHNPVAALNTAWFYNQNLYGEEK